VAQRLFFDRPAQAGYLVLVLAGCHSAPGAVVPADAQPLSSAEVAQWVAATVPKDHRIHKFKWLFRDEKSSAGGRGSARIAPPDSMRFDVAGPFGSGASSAAVVGETPLMWGLFGVARMPAAGAEVRGLHDERMTAWEYAEGTDTIAYVRTPGRPERMVTTVRRAGELLGRAETTLDSLGAPLTARLTVPSVPARLDLTFLSNTRADFAPDIWAPRKP
jgi:hypothetical protein